MEFSVRACSIVRLMLLLAVFMLALPVRAHNSMTSWATLRVTPDTLVLEAEIAAETAMELLGTPSEPGAAPVNPSRLTGPLRTQVELGNMFRLAAGRDRVPVQLQVTDVTVKDDDGLRIVVGFAPPSVPDVTVQVLFLHQLNPQHRCAVSVLGTDGRVHDSMILGGGKAAAAFVVPGLPLITPAATESAPGVSSAASQQPVRHESPRQEALFRTYLVLGIEHILTGYDHLLFLLALLVACRRLRSAVAVVSCFTLGHSVTLALAALDVVTVPSAVVEPLIAASIVYVGIENLVRREEPRGRWLLTLGFGLVHGFGFAGVLREIGFGGTGSAIAWPLAAFNLGVEVGQLVVVAIALPIVLALRCRPQLARYEVPVASTVVVALGLFWLVQRLVTA